MKTAVKDVQRGRASRLHLDPQRDADVGKDHACGFDDAHQHRQEGRKLWRNMVGALGVGLAVRQTERTLVVALVATARCHIGAGFGQRRLRAAASHLVPATRTGVRRRCQLDCQEDNKEEAGEQGMPASRATQE